MSSAPVEPRRIRRVMIANRGEVVIRISRTLRFMGIESVAIYTDADSGAPFTAATDASISIGGNKNYLNIDAVVKAGLQMQCDAVHPGYGFLAENANFAAAVRDAGMLFIGPTAESIRALGSKSEAKRLLASKKSGVPVIPGFIAEQEAQATMTPADWKVKAEAVGYPVLIKAAAGGGGKGMRVVRDPAEFLQSFDAVLTEAKGAFGDSTVLLERYFDDVRHIEVQMLGDHHGGVLHLFERECSIQRRHQKLLEECPAASLPMDLRTRICEAAVKVGKTIAYQNAGTVEFIVDGAKGEFYFLEVNTRLQVEHAVTELCTGVDIVAAQVRIAEGMRVEEAVAASPRRSDIYGSTLTKSIPPTATSGFAIEARVYAEDDNFAPSVGTVTAVVETADAEYHTTVAPGTSVGVHYDGLLTKVIAYSTTSRAAAVDALFAALRKTVIFGVQQSNRKALMRLLQHPAVVSGDMATNLIDKGHIQPAYLRAPVPSRALGVATTNGRMSQAQADPLRIAAAVASEVIARRNKVDRRPAGPWRAASSGWSNVRAPTMAAPRVLVASHDQAVQLSVSRVQESTSAATASRHNVVVLSGGGDAEQPVSIAFVPDWTATTPPSLRAHPAGAPLSFFTVSHVDGAGAAVMAEPVVAQIAPADPLLWAADDDKTPVLEMVHVQLFESGNSYSFGIVDRHAGNAAVSRPPVGSMLPANYGSGASAAGAAFGDQAAASEEAAPGAAEGVPVRSPIPAKVVRVEVATGAAVKKGDVVVVLESMKMETKIAAPCDGTVAVRVKAGDMVQGSKVMFTVAESKA